jgi:dolichol-phosphate mannosyltransferase
MKIVINIPTYNERENIENIINIIEKEVIPKISHHKIAILVIDDNSPDGTSDIVRKLISKYSNLKLLTGEKKGLGAAYIRGMSLSVDKMGADALVEIDADLSHPPEKLIDLVKKMDEGYDTVIGTRYSNGGSIPSNWPIQRKAFSVFGNLLVRIVLLRPYIHDWTGGFKIIKKEVLLKEKKELLNYNGYVFQVAFLHKTTKDGFKIAEVPYAFSDRTLGKSKIASGSYMVDVLNYIIRARIYESLHSPFLKYAITGFLGYLINAFTLELFSQRLGLQSGIAALLGAECSIVWNFTVNNFWAFGEHKITNPWKVILKFPQFNLVSVGSLVIITTIVFTATHIFEDTLLVRQLSLAIAIGFFVIPYSYSMYNIFIWKRWRISFLSKIQEKLG